MFVIDFSFHGLVAQICVSTLGVDCGYFDVNLRHCCICAKVGSLFSSHESSRTAGWGKQDVSARDVSVIGAKGDDIFCSPFGLWAYCDLSVIFIS